MRRMMFSARKRACFAAMALSLIAAEAHAINRYTSTSMTCAAAAATISSEGAAIMSHQSTRTGNLIYDRYVRNRQFCQPNETTVRAWIPTSDRKSCPVYRCKEIQFSDLR